MRTIGGQEYRCKLEGMHLIQTNGSKASGADRR